MGDIAYGDVMEAEQADFADFFCAEYKTLLDVGPQHLADHWRPDPSHLGWTRLERSHPVTVHAKMLRLELLNVKGDLERDLEQLVLDCSACGQTVRWEPGLGVSPGHRA